jgi:Holliday junction resolvase RusA-like endonuclease
VITFTVPGNPVAQPRVAAAKRGKFIHIYTPEKKIKPYKDAIKLIATQAMAGNPPLEGPIDVCIHFYLDRPKSHSKKQRECDWHAQKPDIDNLTKAVFDALNEICFQDDSQICQLRVRKEWAHGDPAYTYVRIEAVQ